MDITLKITSRKTVEYNGQQTLKGFIKIGDDFKETIFVYLDPWTKEDYERQWSEGIKRLKTHDTSCLITCVSDPKSSAVVGWWRLYRVDDTVFIHNGYLSKANYKKIVGKAAFTPETCYDFVTPRITHTKEGHKVSEWSVPYE
jgi:hypothetical protein